jgi:hypothetical protein
VSLGELTSQTVDVVKVSVTPVLVLLLQFEAVKGLVIELGGAIALGLHRSTFEDGLGALGGLEAVGNLSGVLSGASVRTNSCAPVSPAQLRRCGSKITLRGVDDTRSAVNLPNVQSLGFPGAGGLKVLVVGRSDVVTLLAGNRKSGRALRKDGAHAGSTTGLDSDRLGHDRAAAGNDLKVRHGSTTDDRS